MWQNWKTGKQDWDLGNLSPDEVLYYLDGPAIFTCRIGFSTYLFFKSDELDTGDYYIAAPITQDELQALKDGRLSVRGALSQPTIWLLQLDFDLRVKRYEEKREAEVRTLLPKSGVPLFSKFRTAPDSPAQTDAFFAFKFLGDKLSEKRMPFSTFKNLVDNVHDLVRGALTPPSLSAGYDRRFMDFAVRQPEFASLLIAIDRPTIDAKQLRARARTRNLDPDAVAQEVRDRSRAFAEQVERAVNFATTGRLPERFAAENFAFLQKISNILPASGSDISKLQFSSNANGAQTFVEIDAAAGDRIRGVVEGDGHSKIYITGVVTGIIGKSNTFRIDTDFNREVTCQLDKRQFDELLEQDRLKYGVRIGVKGRYRKRDFRDWMEVEGSPDFL